MKEFMDRKGWELVGGLIGIVLLILLGWGVVTLVIGLVSFILPYLIGAVVVLAVIYAVFHSGNSGRSGGTKHSMFQSSARDGLGDRPRDAGDQVSDARDGVSHPYRTGRDRRNGR